MQIISMDITGAGKFSAMCTEMILEKEKAVNL
jgi:hypothetical protein